MQPHVISFYGILLFLPLGPETRLRKYRSHSGLLCQLSLRRQMPPRLQQRKRHVTEKGGNEGEEWPMNLAVKWQLPRHLKGSLTCRKSATWDRRLYFRCEGRHAVDFFALKNPTASAGFEPTNSCTRGQHANSVGLRQGSGLCSSPSHKYTGTEGYSKRGDTSMRSLGETGEWRG
jgi:hypothetical protein